MSEKPAFDPTQPFEPSVEAKPAFDPNKPFDANEPSLGGLAENAFSNAKRMFNPVNIVKGGAETVKEGAFDLPMDLHKTLAQLVGEGVTGKDTGQTPMGGRMQQISESEEVQHPAQWAYKNPLDAAMQAATVISPFIPEASAADAARQEAALRASRLAQQQAVKTMEGSRGQIMQLGPDEARQLGQFALDKNIVSPFKGELGMERSLNALEQETGSQIGSARAAGDALGGAPKVDTLLEKIKAELEPRYTSGMRSSELGGLKNAMDEVQALRKTPELPIMEGSKTGDPYALFQGNFDMGPENKYSTYRVYGEHERAGGNFGSAELEKMGIPIKGREARAAGVQPEGLYQEPNFSQIAGKATEMNAYAKRPHQMTQGSGGLTDVANILSRENNAALKQALSPQEFASYQQALSDYGAIQKLQEFFLRKESRELAGRGGGIIRGVKDAFGHKIAATAANSMAGLLSHPAFAKVLPMLTDAAKRGPQALTATNFVLQQQDPEYNKLITQGIDGTQNQ